MTNPPQNITDPIPLAVEDGEPIFLSAAWVNFIRRKIEAPANMQADYPLRIIRSDAGMRLVLVE